MKALDVLQELIIGYMGINERRIWAYNNDVNIPKDKGIYVVLEIARIQTVANNKRYVPNANNDLVEQQGLLTATDVIIHFVSRDMSARDNVDTLILAFNSDLCEQIQENNACHISRIGELVDASSVEGDGNLTRFDLRVRVITGKMVIKEVDYYDTFSKTFLVQQ